MTKRIGGIAKLIKLLGFLSMTAILAAIALSVEPTLDCEMGDIMKSDVAAQAEPLVVEVEPGVLDFRKLSDQYARICTVEVYGPGEIYGIPGLDSRQAKLMGHRVCGGWRRDGASFALIKTRDAASPYALFSRQFTRLPPGHRPPTDDNTCSPTESAVARCADRGTSGVYCAFQR